MNTRPSEFALIAELFAPLAKDAPGAFGLTDDAAAIEPPPGHQLVVTTDCMVSGIHFREDDTAATAASRTLRSNLSDLASMGATPAGYTLALALPRDLQLPWIEEFAATLAVDQALFSISLLGGDTVSTSGPATISITALGWSPNGHLLRRNGASPGDDIWCSGTIGDAGLGLQLAQRKFSLEDRAATDYLISRYEKPTPRLVLGKLIRGIATAAIDVSDGFLADLQHICVASQVAAQIDAGRIPCSDAATTAVIANQLQASELWSSGDDYELVFTAPPEAAARIEDIAVAANTAVSRVGLIGKGAGIALNDKDGNAITIKQTGFRHF